MLAYYLRRRHTYAPTGAKCLVFAVLIQLSALRHIRRIDPSDGLNFGQRRKRWANVRTA